MSISKDKLPSIRQKDFNHRIDRIKSTLQAATINVDGKDEINVEKLEKLAEKNGVQEAVFKIVDEFTEKSRSQTPTGSIQTYHKKKPQTLNNKQISSVFNVLINAKKYAATMITEDQSNAKIAQQNQNPSEIKT